MKSVDSTSGGMGLDKKPREQARNGVKGLCGGRDNIKDKKMRPAGRQ